MCRLTLVVVAGQEAGSTAPVEVEQLHFCRLAQVVSPVLRVLDAKRAADVAGQPVGVGAGDA